MIRIRKWALAACWALLLTSYLAITNAQNLSATDPTQVYTTGNLVNSGVDPTSTTSTWQNVGLWNQGLPCWAPGGPVYCGPQPYFNNGSFNFSYGYTDVYQVANIAAALPNSGTGLRVNGFNFGFTAKNGNGWDNGQQDYLVAYVNIYGADGKLAQGYNYGAATNQLYNWTTFNFSETFATPYAAKDLSTARYGFVGYDTNFWAGPYGPEIYGVNFSLKYSVDPCSVDVLSSPSCPGYLDAIAKLTPPTPTVAPATTTTSTAPATTTAPAVETTQPTAVTTSANTVTSAPVVSTATAATTATPTATNPQPRVGEVTVSGSPARTTVSTSQILSIVRAEQTRISAVETAAVQEAVSQAQQSAQTAVETATQVVAASSARSTASIYSLSTGPIPVNSAAAPMASISTAVANPVTINRSAEVAFKPQESTQSTEGIKLTSPVAALNIVNTNAINTVETQAENKDATVNTRVQDNEAAGGVSLTAMARQPVGFNAYTTAMPDTAFYVPKEIYRNQRVVDNARAQRLLSGASDQLHQRMIEQQYK